MTVCVCLVVFDRLLPAGGAAHLIEVEPAAPEDLSRTVEDRRRFETLTDPKSSSFLLADPSYYCIPTTILSTGVKEDGKCQYA